MASHESSEDSAKSSITDKVNTMAQPRTDENKSLTTSPSIDRHDEPTDTAADTKEKKNLTSDATNDCKSVQKNDSDSDNIKNKDHLKSLVNDENKQDDSKTDKKKETQNVASLVDPQNTGKEKEVKSEDAPTKGSVLKRKRKRLAQCARSS